MIDKSEAVEALVPRLGQKVRIADHFPDSEEWNKDDWYVVGLTTELGRKGVNVWIGPEYPIASEGPTDGFWVNRFPQPDALEWSDCALSTPAPKADGLVEELEACPNIKNAQLRPFDAPEQFLVDEPLRDRILAALKDRDVVLEEAAKKLERLQEWLRQPDNAECFGQAEIIAWLNARPTSTVPKVLAALKERV